MAVAGVLDHKGMKIELRLQVFQRPWIGLAQCHPDQAVRLGGIVMDFVDRDVGDFVAVLVCDATDQHRGLSLSRPVTAIVTPVPHG
jgi:hypothetical protein